MPQPSSFFLHRIAAVFLESSPTLTITTTMYSAVPPPFRGGRGRGRRSFSDRPSTAFVSGDSHFQSVHDSNFNLQRSSEFRSFNNSKNENINNNNYNSPPNRGRRGGGGGGYGFRGRSPSFNQSPGARVQRPKPADFRSWEFAKSPPPPHCERFVVLSYNILADYLANSHRKLYFHIPRRFMSWEWRKGNILFELRLWSPDIMCFQEVDKFHDIEEDLKARGYSGIWKMRTGDPIDGCAIFWQTTRFKLMYEESVEFNKHGMRDNVAQICVLESLTPNLNKDQLASSVSSKGPNRVVICNIHVLYNPRRGEIKLGQVRILLERAQAVSKTWDDAPVVLCGDFNCTPKSPLYNFISEQKVKLEPSHFGMPNFTVVMPCYVTKLVTWQLDISEVDRDKVSRQASAVIEPPPRQYGPQFRVQPTGDLTGATSVPNISIDSTQCDSLEKENDKECVSEDIQKTVSLQELPVVSSQNVLVNLSENNRELIDSTDSLTDSQGYHIHMSKDETRLAKSTLPESVEVNTLGATGELNLTRKYEASDPNTSSALNYDIDEKSIGLSLNEVNEHLEDDEDLGEDAKECLSDINNSGDASSPYQNDLVLVDETADVDKPYDPSLWTPMEIKTATGNADSSVLEHPLKLRSTYSEVVDSSGTRDSNGEPLVTSFNTCFMGTVDYIWRSEGLCTSKVLGPIAKNAMQPSGGFPTKKWGSDHIALASELAFTKEL